MNPDFVSVHEGSAVSDALEAVRRSELESSQLLSLCVVDNDGLLAGTVSLARLVRASDEATLSSLIDPAPVVSAETDLPEVARLMADFNLTAMPVVDGDNRPIGVVAVDDVLELVLPAEWRRRAGAARQ
jgi:Mg/Co/Ni transporter MgtE